MWQLFQRVLKASLHVFFAFASLFERLEQVIRKSLTKMYKPRAYIFVEGVSAALKPRRKNPRELVPGIKKAPQNKRQQCWLKYFLHSREVLQKKRYNFNDKNISQDIKVDWFVCYYPRFFSLNLNLNIWFRAGEVTGTFDKGTPRELPYLFD